MRPALTGRPRKSSNVNKASEHVGELVAIVSNTSNEVLLLVTLEQALAFVGRDSQGHGLIAEPIRKCSPGEYAMSAKAEWPFQLVSRP